MPDAPPRPRVVIIGGGFGGLSAAKALARAPVDITLIDQRNHHLFQPLLYQVATAALSPAEIAWPVRGVTRHQANVTVLMRKALSVDLDARTVDADGLALPYDHLIIATGATHSYFGHSEWEAHAPGLKTLADATAIRARILSAFEKAEAALDDSEQQRLMTFVLVGGGPTGVEMAGAMAELARQALKQDFRRINPLRARIILIEAGPRILPAFPEGLAAYSRRELEKMGVEVMAGAKVVGIDETGVDLEHGRIICATKVWAAGVAASELVAGLPGPHDRAGRAVVGADLTLEGHPEVYVIGDAAAVTDADGKTPPGVAPPAKQEGKHVGEVIAAHLAGADDPGPFRYKHAGDLATIGRNAAIVKLGETRLTGFVGWLFWSLVHVYFLIGARSRVLVAIDWAWSWLTWHRGVRLIVN